MVLLPPTPSDRWDYLVRSEIEKVDDVFVAKLNHLPVRFTRESASRLFFIRNNKNLVSSLQIQK